MSGPIIGRRLGRRQNNSEIGSLETIHDAGTGSPSNRANTYEDSRAFNYGIRTMDQVTRGVFNSTYRDLASGGGGSTTNHQVFSNTVNSNNEQFGGGAVGEDVNHTTRGANALRIYGNSRFNQSKYPYYTPFFAGNEISTLMQPGGQAGTSGYGGPNAQGYRDSTSRAAQWKFRQVINVAYTGGGYKDGSPWRQIHRTNCATHQTTNLGIQMDHPGSYISGACSDTTFFLWSTPSDNSHFTPSSRTSAFHMYSETGKSHNSVFNTYSDRNDSGTSFKETFLSFHGGGDRTGMEVFNLATEARQSSNGGDLRSGSTNSAFSDKDQGYHWADSAGWKVNHQTFAVSGSSHWSAHGQQKGMPTKVRVGYCGNEGSYSGGYNLRRWNLTNDSNTGTFSKYRANCGEENFTLGQDWGYMIGNYDGAQNNGTWQQYYHTDTRTDHSGLQPSANAGQSSGHCGWRT
jgi:hypothetical protein